MVMSGDDNLALSQMACGMDGVISVAANAFPAEFSQMIQHCIAQNFVAAKRINDQLLEAYTLMFEENNPAGIKAFLTEMNIMENVLRLPLVPLSNSLHEKVKRYLARS
jgi:4-hydroxy-tetrahydrodipicolinate synthase